MKKKTLIIFSALFLIGTVIFLLTFNHHLLLWNINAVRVKVDKPLTVDKVKIEYGMSANAYNLSTPGDIPNRQRYDVLVYDGRPKDKVPNEYGENDFLITYDDTYYLFYRHFKTNWKYQHNYNFHFYQKHDTVFVRADIKGVNNQTFDRPMLKLNR